jgi:hypothetical protein
MLHGLVGRFALEKGSEDRLRFRHNPRVAIPANA